MSNYLPELEAEILLRYPNTYNKLRKSHSDDIVTYLGVCVRNKPCWYIYSEYDWTVITIDLYVIDERADFNELVWSLTTSSSSNSKGVKHIHKYLIKPDEVAAGFETVDFTPGARLDKDDVRTLTVKQLIDHISIQYQNS